MTKPADDWPKANAFRSGVARGLDKTRGKVDRENSRINGLAVITEGEALGHGVFIEAEQIAHAVKLGNDRAGGLKARFGHPNMSSTALGTYMGKETNFYLDDSSGVAIARADMNFSEAARKSPGFSNDPVDYLLDLAETEPDMFGTSIVFKPGKTYVRDEKGKKIYDYYEIRNNCKFRKPEFQGNKEFIEIEDLRANDFVDQPAANPGGLFSSGNVPLAAEATRFFDEHPELFELLEEGDAQEIVQGFLDRYSERSGESRTLPRQASIDPSQGMPTDKTNDQLSDELEALSAVTLKLRNDLAGAYLTISKLKGDR